MVFVVVEATVCTVETGLRKSSLDSVELVVGAMVVASLVVVKGALIVVVGDADVAVVTVVVAVCQHRVSVPSTSVYVATLSTEDRNDTPSAHFIIRSTTIPFMSTRCSMLCTLSELLGAVYTIN